MLAFVCQTPCGVTVLWMCTRQNILSFSLQRTFSGGQVSEPGQTGKREPGGRQGCAGKHQHQNKLQHSSNIVSKPEGKNRKQKSVGGEREKVESQVIAQRWQNKTHTQKLQRRQITGRRRWNFFTDVIFGTYVRDQTQAENLVPQKRAYWRELKTNPHAVLYIWSALTSLFLMNFSTAFPLIGHQTHFNISNMTAIHSNISRACYVPPLKDESRHNKNS